MATEAEKSKQEVLHLRLTAEKSGDFHAAAKIEKLRVSTWMLRTCEFEAERVLNAAKTK